MRFLALQWHEFETELLREKFHIPNLNMTKNIGGFFWILGWNMTCLWQALWTLHRFFFLFIFISVFVLSFHVRSLDYILYKAIHFLINSRKSCFYFLYCHPCVSSFSWIGWPTKNRTNPPLYTLNTLGSCWPSMLVMCLFGPKIATD